MRDILKLGLVLRVGLHAERSREYELADGCAEAREKRIKRKVADNDYVEELQCAYCNEEAHECVEELCPLRGLGVVFVPDALEDVLRVGVGA